jgi:plastocyanin
MLAYKMPRTRTYILLHTMKFVVVGSLILSLGGAVVQAANHVVQVAPQDALMYSPSSLTAAVGDTIEFQFESNVHL